jgi:hypothetical protein
MGRPPKNAQGRIDKSPINNPSVVQPASPSDGFNVRKNTVAAGETGSSDLLVLGVYTHPTTNDVYYRVKEFGQTSVKDRRWVLGRSKIALI